jgi:hypothetical protein
MPMLGDNATRKTSAIDVTVTVPRGSHHRDSAQAGYKKKRMKRKGVIITVVSYLCSTITAIHASTSRVFARYIAEQGSTTWQAIPGPRNTRTQSRRQSESFKTIVKVLIIADSECEEMGGFRVQPCFSSSCLNGPQIRAAS